jgi:hypothetical protein
VHADGGEQVGVGGGQHRGHGATGGQAGEVDPLGVHRMVTDELFGDTGDDRGLADVGRLVFWSEPVPEAVGVGIDRLLGIRHQEVVVVGEGVHRRAGSEVGGILLPAVQHDQQWPWVAAGSGRNVQLDIA